MIFVTVGTQLAFPRLMAAMDALAPTLAEPIVAQVGPDTTPRTHLDVRANLTPAEFSAQFTAARVVVAHAGIGTVLTAKQLGKPLILVPRRFDQGEHRNDHQMATARELSMRQGLYVAWDMTDLQPLLQRPDLGPPDAEIGPKAAQLHAEIRQFIAG